MEAHTIRITSRFEGWVRFFSHPLKTWKSPYFQSLSVRMEAAGGAFLVFVFIFLCATGCFKKISPDASSKSGDPDTSVEQHKPEKTYGKTGRNRHKPAKTYSEVGVASWYGEDFHSKPTASGEPYDMNAMTAAHRTLPLGTLATVVHQETKRSVQVRINDRGPFVKNRILDLSREAAKALGIYQKGTGPVEIRVPYSEDLLNGELGYWVQVGAYRNRKAAEDVARRMHHRNSETRIVTRESVHRIRLGPFSCEDEAGRVRDVCRKEGMEAYVIRDLFPLSSQTQPTAKQKP